MKPEPRPVSSTRDSHTSRSGDGFGDDRGHSVGPFPDYDLLRSLCTPNDSEFTVWGSGFGSNEIVILAVIKDKDTAIIWSTGNANVSGAFEITKNLVTKPPNATSDKARWPGAGLYSVEALSVRGRLATTPVLFADDKCPGSE